MKKIKFSLLAITVLFSTTTVIVHAQNADSIISKHIAAIGGKDKIAAINSMYMETNSQIMGNDNNAKITILNGKGYKMETSFNGQQIVQAMTDKGGWGINPLTGNSDAQEMPDEQFNASKDQLNVGGTFANYPANGDKAEYTGTDNTTHAYMVKITEAGGLTITDYFDTATYYILKSVVSLGGQESTVAFSDYKKTDYGYTMPFTVETTLPQGLTITSTVTKVTFNDPVDPKIFEMPK
jgi:outer membrane lipoprotein-sorting protein